MPLGALLRYIVPYTPPEGGLGTGGRAKVMIFTRHSSSITSIFCASGVRVTLGECYVFIENLKCKCKNHEMLSFPFYSFLVAQFL